MSRRVRWLRTASVAIFAVVGHAHAWMSGPDELEGRDFARSIVLTAAESDPANEHGELLARAMNAAGLDEILTNRVYWLPLYVGSDATKLTPQRFDLFGLRLSETRRGYNIAGTAGLPDHAYSLFDWAQGQEQCPEGTFGGECYRFRSHMGPLNSNHFLPQAQNTYQYYHAVAMERARFCGVMALGVSESEEISAFREIVLECEREALLVEAFGQHFLQDAWAIGHMWHRWGTPDASSFASRDRAVAVALVSGMLHGSEPVLRAVEDDLSSGTRSDIAFDLDDSEELDLQSILFVAGDNVRGVGDLHRDRLEGPEFVDQSERLLACSVGGLLEVYGETAQWSGEAATGVTYPSGDDLTGAHCFGQRATNRAMYDGWGTSIPGQSVAPMASILEGLKLFRVDGTGLDSATENQLRHELGNISLTLGSNLGPHVLGFALFRFPGLYTGSARAVDAHMQSLLGADEGGAYRGNGGVAPYADPISVSTWGHSSGPESGMARLFHRAHASEWCEATETDPGNLKSRVAAIEPATGPDADPEELKKFQAACSVCTEFVSRHIRLDRKPSICTRLGKGGKSFDLERAPQSVLLDPLKDAAAKWCGCSVAGVDLEIKLARPATEWLNLPTVVELRDLTPNANNPQVPVPPGEFRGNVGSTCSKLNESSEEGAPLFSRSVAADAVLFPANVVSNAPSEPLTAISPRRNCSSFVAVRNVGTVDERVWLNATYKVERPSNGLTYEWQTRFSSDDPATPEDESQMVIGRVRGGTLGDGNFYPAISVPKDQYDYRIVYSKDEAAF